MSEKNYDPMTDTSKGSARSRGSRDAYYGSDRRPHKIDYSENPVFGRRIEDIGPKEVEAYNYAYDNELDRKIWD